MLSPFAAPAARHLQHRFLALCCTQRVSPPSARPGLLQSRHPIPQRTWPQHTAQVSLGGIYVPPATQEQRVFQEDLPKDYHAIC